MEHLRSKLIFFSELVFFLFDGRIDFINLVQRFVDLFDLSLEPVWRLHSTNAELSVKYDKLVQPRTAKIGPKSVLASFRRISQGWSMQSTCHEALANGDTDHYLFRCAALTGTVISLLKL